MRSRYLQLILAIAVSFPCLNARASVESTGPNGINSATLPLTGAGVSIGQVEFHRPAKFLFDDGHLSNASVRPEEVFLLDGRVDPTPNAEDELYDEPEPEEEPDAHATKVAGVMIGQSAVVPGVARDAKLYATAGTYPTVPFIPTFDSLAISSQFIANQDNGNVRAINMSFLVPYEPNGVPDGNSKLTQFIDWSASEHDVLYATGIPNSNTPFGISQPSDNFNGLTIARSTMNNGVFSQVSSGSRFNEDAVGDRTSVDLIAPGDDIDVPDLAGVITTESGASYAIPHVTGTVALLQEYGDSQVLAGAPHWDGLFDNRPTSQRHEVMKAVLMNSADKIKDNRTVQHPVTGQLIEEGRLLGMERTVLKQNGNDTWFQSEAYLDEDEFGTFLDTDTPLDEEMGTGHLNAKRALQQFIPGQHEVNGHFGTPIVGEVPHIGWDFGTISGASFPINKYKLEGTLEAGHFFSATLAWDRKVEFAVDGGTQGVFDEDDTFQPYTNLDDVLTDLDLYLVPAGTNDVGEDDIAISQSSVFPVEHIFTEIPFTGEYELWVYRKEQFAPPQDYGLAWWYGLAPEIEPPDDVTGDFNGDGIVDGEDFLAWQRDPGIGDLADWETGFGTSTPLAASSVAVPEPNALTLLLAAS